MVYIFSSVFAKEGSFDVLVQGKNPSAVLFTPSECQTSLKKLKSGDLVYYEAGKDLEENKKVFRALQKQTAAVWGILDPYGVVEDTAQLFHSGCSDYLGTKMRKIPMKKTRFTTVMDYAGVSMEEPVIKGIPSFTPSQATIGKEYAFTFLLVEVADQSGFKRALGETKLTKFRSSFVQFLNGTFQESGGVLWMQQEFSFLIAYPEKEVTSAVSTGLKLILSRSLLSLESFQLNHVIQFQCALHKGTAPWQKPGETGKVISDAVNSIFHLGQKRAVKNTLTLTQDCLNDFPQRLTPLLISEGEYEGRNIYRLPIIQS